MTSRKANPLGDVRTQSSSACPHCGDSLSPWEKVLLNVDRALMCKHCWYRIILDVRPTRVRQERSKDNRKEQNAMKSYNSLLK